MIGAKVGVVGLLLLSVVVGATAAEKSQVPQLTLFPLPYDEDALEPFVSAETLQYHHGKHVKGYVEKSNHLLNAAGSEFSGMTLEDIILRANGTLFNQAAQIWNHQFYFHCMAPPSNGCLEGFDDDDAEGGGATCAPLSLVGHQHNNDAQYEEIPSPIRDAIIVNFGNVSDFKKQFTDVAGRHFGSGWVWLVAEPDEKGTATTGSGGGRLKIHPTDNAMNPLRDGSGYPLLVVDVWEHAYYIDYRNAKTSHLEAWWNVVNWKFVAENYNAVVAGTIKPHF